LKPQSYFGKRMVMNLQKNMKLLTILITFAILCGNATAATKKSKKRPCNPVTGDTAQSQVKELNRFKNRTQPPSLFDFDPTITIQKILTRGNDVNRLPMTSYSTITTYAV